MELVTSSFCIAVANLGKKSNKEIMSLDTTVVRSLGGPSKRMMQGMRKNIVDALEVSIFAMIDIIQFTAKASREVDKSIKELV